MMILDNLMMIVTLSHRLVIVNLVQRMILLAHLRIMMTLV
jgi:hypothetical protein